MSKKELRIFLNISKATLSRLLNQRYFDELCALGYKKSVHILPNVVVQRFIEIYGKTVKLMPEEI